MREVRGDIWSLAHFHRDAIVIPTNIGYNKHGNAIMGRGLAAQASTRFQNLLHIYGELCIEFKADTPAHQLHVTGPSGGRWLILFPTKSFRADRPEMSWQGKSDMKLIERGLHQLASMGPPQLNGKIYVPLLGCGRGGLRREPVRELMDSILKADHFVRIRSLH